MYWHTPTENRPIKRVCVSHIREQRVNTKHKRVGVNHFWFYSKKNFGLVATMDNKQPTKNKKLPVVVYHIKQKNSNE